MSPEPSSSFIRTSITGSLLPRLARTHERRRIAVFSGPPGIGKSTAIEAFRAAHDEFVGVVSVPPSSKGGIKAIAALQLSLEAIYDASPEVSRETVPTSYSPLRQRVYAVVSQWCGLRNNMFRGGREPVDLKAVAPFTIVFDEAQNFSKQAIEQLRFLNDERGGYTPFPLGLVFIGNSEFALKTDARGESVLSAAVSDRALYVDALEYTDVKDDDLVLFFKARGMEDDGVVKLLVSYFAGSRTDRSFRRAADLLDELKEIAKDEPITPALARFALGLR